MANDGAAAVIIGNEVLSAKVREENGARLIERLSARGIAVRSVNIVPDEIDAIVAAVMLARRTARWVFTSGGIGPTHDDVTVRAVSLSLGRRVVRLPEMERRVREFYGDQTTPEALRLADAPEGAELIEQEGSWYPVLACDGVFLLPGVPMLFRRQLETVLTRLPTRKVALVNLYLSLREPAIAAALDQVALSFTDVAIGSYPSFDDVDYRVKVTVEHPDDARVDEAVSRILAALPNGALVRRS